jgi:PKD domain
MGCRRTVLLLGVVALACGSLLAGPNRAVAQACGGQGVEGDLTGAEDTAVILGRASSCTSRPTASEARPASSYYTFEITCSPNRTAALDGVCSATPCRSAFFALRTLHRPDGTTSPAGFRCVTLTQASATPGLSAAQVFAAVRRVRLPGGRITAVPHHQGLANLPAYFHLQGATQPPVDLPVATATVHAVFHPVGYRWSFGDGQRLATTSPGSRGVGSEVQVAYARRGRFRVRVTVGWVAEAFVGGRRVGRVEGLASASQLAYPVAEVRAVLTG